MMVRTEPSGWVKLLLTSVSSATSLPLGTPEATSIFTLPTFSRRAARSPRRFCNRVMRLWLRVRRASTPLRIQISS